MANTLDILQKLVAFKTVSHMSNMALIDYVRSLLTEAGAKVTIIESSDGRKANLYATIGPRNKPGVLLSGHTDVVPIIGQEWSVPAFSLTEKKGYLYGRGTTDMKGFLACALFVALKASKENITTPMHLALSYDEEIGCVGVRSLIDMLKEAPFRPLFCIVGEPTEMAVATGHKGKTAAKAICKGQETHSTLAPNGMNAIHLATDFVTGLRVLQDEISQNGKKDPDLDIPYSTIHTGKIRGGEALNIVPNSCEVDFEIRNVADDSPDAIFEKINKISQKISRTAEKTHEGTGITLSIENSYPGLNTDLTSQVVKFVKSLTGANTTSKVSFGTEGGLFDKVLNVPTVICGPGSMEQGHKPDEYIALSELEKCEKMLLVLLQRLKAGL